MDALSSVLSRVKYWCYQVGEVQKSAFRTPIKVGTKSSVTDLVTEIDHRSEEILLQAIQHEYPGTAILSEETGRNNIDSEYMWVIDPLDGTTNYAQGLPVFVVSIALQHNGQSVLGVIYAPYLNEMFTAVKGEGAHCNGQVLQVQKKTQLNQCVIASGGPHSRGEVFSREMSHLHTLIPKVRGIRKFGAAAYSLSLLAGGYIDAYWESPLQAWDLAAGQIIVEEAGGMVEVKAVDHGYEVMASHQQLIELIKKERV